MTDPARPAPTIVVVGAGAANLKSTVAANLAAALVALDHDVALLDLDGASSRALPADADGTARLPWASRPIHVVTAARPDAITVIDPPPRLGTATADAVANAALVLVPVDATPLALRVLREVAALVADRPASLRVVLGRLVPRDVDRWGLVDAVAEAAPGALLRSTLPMARTVRPASRGAVLYAPGTAAARAYAALARELLLTLSTAP